jgi:hypothetical protein
MVAAMGCSLPCDDRAIAPSRHPSRPGNNGAQGRLGDGNKFYGSYLVTLKRR